MVSLTVAVGALGHEEAGQPLKISSPSEGTAMLAEGLRGGVAFKLEAAVCNHWRGLCSLAVALFTGKGSVHWRGLRSLALFTG